MLNWGKVEDPFNNLSTKKGIVAAAHHDAAINRCTLGQALIAVNSTGQTPLQMAVHLGEHVALRTLLRLGAPPDLGGWSEWTPLMHAIAKGDMKMAQMLVDHGASINHVAQQPWTPLLVASVHGQTQMVSWLLDLNVDVEATAARVPKWCYLHGNVDTLFDIVHERQQEECQSMLTCAMSRRNIAAKDFLRACQNS